MMNMKRIFGTAVFCLAGVASAAQAGTAAYWRHEDQPSGSLIPAGPDTVLDSSGNGNNMRTFDPTFTSATYSNIVSPLPLRSGLPNTLSLNFGPGGDDPGQNDDDYSDGKAINGQLFSAMTVELAFRMNSVGGFQALFGKDGKPLASSPVPPFKVLVRGDNFPNAVPNQLFIEWFDGQGVDRFLAGGKTITPGVWNHVAFTLSATDAQLWVADETSPYQLASSLSGQNFAGTSGEVLINSVGNYSIGRGMFNGGVTDWSDARIDEVRISDVALAPSQFLFVAVPEPQTVVLGLIALVGCWSRRARR